jgi:hypothetical protein
MKGRTASRLYEPWIQKMWALRETWISVRVRLAYTPGGNGLIEGFTLCIENWPGECQPPYPPTGSGLSNLKSPSQ